MKTAILITAHPLSDSFNAELANAWQRGAEKTGASVRRFDATSMAFDPVLRGGYRNATHDEEELAELRAAIESAAHITWIFPTWWVGLPGSLKALIDRLFLPNWAFKYEGHALPKGLLAGRSTRYVSTMDSPGWWYHLGNGDPLKGSFGRGTLSFVGLAPIKRNLIFKMRTLGPEKREAWLKRMEDLGQLDMR